MNPEKKQNDGHNCASLTMTKATMCINTPMNEASRSLQHRRHSTTGSSIPFIVFLLLLICAFPSQTTASRGAKGHIDTTESNPDSSDGSVIDNSHQRSNNTNTVGTLSKQEWNVDNPNQQQLSNNDRIFSESHNDQTVTSAVTIFLPSGFDAKDEDSFAVVDDAILNGHLDIARELCTKMDIDTWGLDEDGPSLHWAAYLGRVDVVQELINQGADIDVKDRHGTTLLHDACANGHLDVVKFLVENKADINAKKNDGTTPLHEASRYGHLDIVKVLVENKADINATKNGDWTPLHDASWKGYLNVAKFLVENKPDVNAKDNDGRTPLHRASDAGHLDIVKLLIDNKADINTKDNDGWTPLHWASVFGHLDVITFLVENNADINAKKSDGRTPLHWASWTARLDIVKVLVENKADINAKDDDGRTPLDIAKQFNKTSVAKYLQSKGAV